VPSFSAATAFLESKGFRGAEGITPVPTADNPRPMRMNPTGKAGFPQIYLLDPDRNLIEINAERLD
jgi:catechol 2,3-dioxygenase-like lactoylglutathione lyase family enzyme